MELLGLRKPFTEDDLNKAYKRCALKYHPDKTGDNDMFCKVHNAYEELKNQLLCQVLYYEIPPHIAFNGGYCESLLCVTKGGKRELERVDTYVKPNTKCIRDVPVKFQQYEDFEWSIENGIMVGNLSITFDKYLAGFERNLPFPNGQYKFVVDGARPLQKPIVIVEEKVMIFLHVKPIDEELSDKLAKYARVFKKMFE